MLRSHEVRARRAECARKHNCCNSASTVSRSYLLYARIVYTEFKRVHMSPSPRSCNKSSTATKAQLQQKLNCNKSSTATKAQLQQKLNCNKSSTATNQRSQSRSRYQGYNACRKVIIVLSISSSYSRHLSWSRERARLDNRYRTTCGPKRWDRSSRCDSFWLRSWLVFRA